MDNQKSNNYMICPRCNQYIPYGSFFCNYCGFQFQYQNNTQIDTKSKKKTESPLSALSGIISLVGFLTFGFLIIIGFIIAVIDLAIGQFKKYDNHIHACSWFSVVLFIILIILMIFGMYRII
uniref:Zinc-ribbon containing domain protein n=1 Tax=Siphoviridae sp. ct7EW56 TaxID=2827562 RepID=A0A8S5LRM6_9CAUD|nr:MAG TPA: zinc-ribbon containing domain protein [Siphoviridae sp. ct7EW56]